MTRLVPLLLAACAASPSPPPVPADYLPFDIGRTWEYEARVAGYEPQLYSARVGGSDVRSLPDEDGVDFMFVYGRPPDMDHDLMKSIYAMASDGPREFYLDTFILRIKHEPPIPLLPAGKTATWEGTISVDRKPVKTKATINTTVDGDRVRSVTTYAATPLEITRWFARGRGMVRLEAKLDGKILLEIAEK